jgi:hypothetical protein
MPFSSAFTETAGVPTGAEDLVKMSKESTDAIKNWTENIDTSSQKIPLLNDNFTRTSESLDRFGNTTVPDVGSSLNNLGTQSTVQAAQGLATSGTSATTAASSLDALSQAAQGAATALPTAAPSTGLTGSDVASSLIGLIPSLLTFASGGYLQPGQMGVVGEAGPELIYGGNSGATITPMSGGSGGDQQINLINNTGVQMSKQQKQTDDGRGNRRTDIVLEEIYSTSSTGTQPRKTMNDFYGVRPRLIRA